MGIGDYSFLIFHFSFIPSHFPLKKNSPLSILHSISLSLSIFNFQLKKNSQLSTLNSPLNKTLHLITPSFFVTIM